MRDALDIAEAKARADYNKDKKAALKAFRAISVPARKAHAEANRAAREAYKAAMVVHTLTLKKIITDAKKVRAKADEAAYYKLKRALGDIEAFDLRLAQALKK
jgi:hypothetical protein